MLECLVILGGGARRGHGDSESRPSHGELRGLLRRDLRPEGRETGRRQESHRGRGRWSNQSTLTPTPSSCPSLEKARIRQGATGLLRRIAAERVEAFTSILTWDEVCWVVTKVLGKSDAVATGKKLLNLPHQHFVEANSAVLSMAQSLMERYSSKGIGPMDAIHCASALTRKAATIASDDGGLDVVKEVKRVPLESFLDFGAQRFA